MINSDKLEKFIKHYCEETSADKEETRLLTEGIKEGAYYGVKQFLKDLWHDASEEPNLEEDSMILINIPDDKMSCMVLPLRAIWGNWKNVVSDLNIIKWLYIDDLLPKKEGEEC